MIRNMINEAFQKQFAQVFMWAKNFDRDNERDLLSAKNSGMSQEELEILEEELWDDDWLITEVEGIRSWGENLGVDRCVINALINYCARERFNIFPERPIISENAPLHTQWAEWEGTSTPLCINVVVEEAV